MTRETKNGLQVMAQVCYFLILAGCTAMTGIFLASHGLWEIPAIAFVVLLLGGAFLAGRSLG